MTGFVNYFYEGRYSIVPFLVDYIFTAKVFFRIYPIKLCVGHAWEIYVGCNSGGFCSSFCLGN